MENKEYFYAQIDENRIVIGVQALHAPLVASNMIALPTLDSALLGKTHVMGTTTFLETPKPVLPEDPRIWWIDLGPFKDRLGMDTLAIYASNHAACKGVVGMIEGRKYIDLKDPRIGLLMQVLINTNQPAVDPVWGGSPLTDAKRIAILTTPTTEAERHIKGLVV